VNRRIGGSPVTEDLPGQARIAAVLARSRPSAPVTEDAQMGCSAPRSRGYDGPDFSGERCL
jgi:hypothetical protein